MWSPMVGTHRNRRTARRTTLATAVLSLLVVGCDDSTASSPPTSTVARPDLGQFGVTIRNSQIQIDVVMFAEDVNMSGNCNGIELGGQPGDTKRSFKILIDGGPLDPVGCVFRIDGTEVAVQYEPTAAALRRVIESDECISLGSEDYWQCPADPSLLDGGGAFVMAPWFVAHPRARSEIEAQ